MMTYSEIVATNFESGAWIIYGRKLSNLEEPKVEYSIHVNHPDASMERATWMDQNKEVAAQLVSTIDTDNVKSKNQDKGDVPVCRKPLIVSNLNGVETSTNAQNAQVEWSVLCAGA